MKQKTLKMGYSAAALIAGQITMQTAGISCLEFSVASAAENTKVGIGESETINFNEDIIRVNVTKGGVVEVQASEDKKSLSITGLKSGNTRIEVRLRNGESKSLSAFVTGDSKPSRDRIQDAVRELREIGNLTVSKGSDRVVVSGSLTNRAQGEKFGDVLARFGSFIQDNTDKPYLNSSAVIEVVNSALSKNGIPNLKVRNYGKILMLQGFAKDPKEKDLALRIARMIEPTIEDGIESDEFSAGQSMAVDVMFLEASQQNDRGVGLLGKGKNTGPEAFGQMDWKGKSGTLGDGKVTWGIAPLGTMLQLVQTKGMSKVLSNPRVVVRSGNEANFHSGGTFFIVEAAKKEGEGSSVFPINYGMSLRVRPKVDPIGNIDTVIQAEVSEVGSNVGSMPSVTKSKTETSVTLKDGNSILLTGFKNLKERKSVERVPLLADIPLIGEFFKSRRFQDEEKEVLVLLTIKKAELGEEQLKIMEKLSQAKTQPSDYTNLDKSSSSQVDFSIFD